MSRERNPAETKPDTPSPEAVYHQRARDDANIAVRDGVLYKWNQSVWLAQDIAHLEGEAFRWLTMLYQKKATPRLAASCVASAVMGAQELPGRHHDNEVVLPLKNGYLHIDLKSGDLQLTEPEKNEGLTYLLDAAFRPEADAPLFHTFLEQIFCLDIYTQNWVQEYVGYTLVGDCRFQTAVFFVGTGANGKSTLAEIIAALHKKVVTLQLNCLSGFRLAPLLDASLVLVDETPQRIDEQALKTLVSGGLTQLDRKFRDPISFRPTAKWIILGNAVPSISDQSYGFWRRMPIVPFARQFKPSQQDHSLTARIISNEMSGVLKWAIAGLIRLIQRGQFPGQAEAMLTAQMEGQRESNSVLAWWSDNRVELNLNFETPRNLVYQDYKLWCGDNGMSPLGVERFWSRLKMIAGGEATDAKVRKIQGQAVRLVPLRLLSDNSAKQSGKIVAGRWS